MTAWRSHRRKGVATGSNFPRRLPSAHDRWRKPQPTRLVARFGEGESFASGDEVLNAIVRGDSFESFDVKPSPRQRSFAEVLARERFGVNTPEELDALAKRLMGIPVDQLTAKQFSMFLQKMKETPATVVNDEPPF